MRFSAFCFVFSIVASGAQAMGPTHSACLQSERSPGHEVCACAQSVADQTLNPQDQERAAQIILDPDHFYQYYGSKNAARTAFLERYRAWGAATTQVCAKK